MHRLVPSAADAPDWFAKKGWEASGDEPCDEDTDQEQGDAVHSNPCGADEHEDMQSANKSIDEQLADLESIMNSCTNESGSVAAQVAIEDPLAQVRYKCDSLREEVMSMGSVRQEMESDLQENVQKLQERVDHQHQEKVQLTERLLEAKQKIEAKRQEMMDWEQELCCQVAAEHAAKQQIHADLSESLQALQAQLADCNRQIQDDWESQAALLQELDAESDSHAHCQAQLHQDRENNWRQNQEVLQNIASNGKAPAMALLFSLSESPIRTEKCFSTLSSVTASEQWRIHQQIARQNDDLVQQMEAEKLRIKGLEVELLEEQKKISLGTLAQEATIAELKRKLLHFQKEGCALQQCLTEWKPTGPPFTPPCVQGGAEHDAQKEEPEEMDAALQTGQEEWLEGDEDDHAEAEAGEDAQNPFAEHDKAGGVDHEQAGHCPKRVSEIDVAWELAENLHQCMQGIEQKKDELKHMTELKADLQECQAEREVKLLEKKQIQQVEQELTEVVKEKQRTASLHDEVKDHRMTLDTLRAQNHALQAAIRAQRKWCFKSRVPPAIPRRPKTPPPDKGRGKGRDKGLDTDRDAIGVRGAPPVAPQGSPSTGPKGSPSTGPRGSPSTGPKGSPSTGPQGSPSTGPTKTPSFSDGTAISDRTPESLPLAGAENVDRCNQSSAEPSAEKKVQWKEAYSFFVCEVGEETWKLGSEEMPAEVSHEVAHGHVPASSIAEAVEWLQGSNLGADCYLVQDEPTSAWYCLWRRGRKNMARKKMESYVRGELPGSHGSGRRNGRHRREHSAGKEPERSGGQPLAPAEEAPGNHGGRGPDRPSGSREPGSSRGGSNPSRSPPQSVDEV